MTEIELPCKIQLYEDFMYEDVIEATLLDVLGGSFRVQFEQPYVDTEFEAGTGTTYIDKEKFEDRFRGFVNYDADIEELENVNSS